MHFIGTSYRSCCGRCLGQESASQNGSVQSARGFARAAGVSHHLFNWLLRRRPKVSMVLVLQWCCSFAALPAVASMPLRHLLQLQLLSAAGYTLHAAASKAACPASIPRLGPLVHGISFRQQGWLEVLAPPWAECASRPGMMNFCCSSRSCMPKNAPPAFSCRFAVLMGSATAAASLIECPLVFN